MGRDYQTSVAPVGELPEATVAAMLELYLANFDGSDEGIFRGDLAEKDEAILLTLDGQLVGFTTLKVFQTPWLDRPARIVYSGDTIVHPQNWGQQALAFAWISRIGRIKACAPEVPLFWFLLVKGHRTFKYLSVFGKSFFPHWSAPRTDLKRLADRLALERFGTDYDPDAGVVRFPVSRGHLKGAIAEASPAELAKEPTRFFFEKNPGYRLGHELVCLCELELFNMNPLAARIFARQLGSVAS